MTEIKEQCVPCNRCPLSLSAAGLVWCLTMHRHLTKSFSYVNAVHHLTKIADAHHAGQGSVKNLNFDVCYSAREIRTAKQMSGNQK